MNKVEELEHFIDTVLNREVGKGLLKWFLSNYSKEKYYHNGIEIQWVDRVNEAKYTKPKLYKSGKMKKSFELSYPSLGELEITNIAESAKNFPYPDVHNNGDAKVPARPFLYSDEATDEEVDRIVTKELDRFFSKYK